MAAALPTQTPHQVVTVVAPEAAATAIRATVPTATKFLGKINPKYELKSEK